MANRDDRPEVESTAGGGLSRRGVANQQSQSNGADPRTPGQGVTGHEPNEPPKHGRRDASGELTQAGDRVTADSNDITHTRGISVSGDTNVAGNPKSLSAGERRLRDYAEDKES
ncbi:MAG TPA: hypothetical protein VEH84_02185 [Alphaproteobacteria bacterium]|nr:hypothetical protein [Alphaproteobacteria bacterium]